MGFEQVRTKIIFLIIHRIRLLADSYLIYHCPHLSSGAQVYVTLWYVALWRNLFPNFGTFKFPRHRFASFCGHGANNTLAVSSKCHLYSSSSRALLWAWVNICFRFHSWFLLNSRIRLFPLGRVQKCQVYTFRLYVSYSMCYSKIKCQREY